VGNIARTRNAVNPSSNRMLQKGIYFESFSRRKKMLRKHRFDNKPKDAACHRNKYSQEKGVGHAPRHL